MRGSDCNLRIDSRAVESTGAEGESAALALESIDAIALLGKCLSIPKMPELHSTKIRVQMAAE